MSNHQKRLSVPKSWPVERKTATFTAKAGAGPHGEDGVPLVVVLRDVLGYVDSAKEATYAINAGGVRVNGQPVDDINRPIGMFDILGFPDREEFYRVFPDEGGRLGLTPIDEADAGSKLGKVIDKTKVSGGRTQLNLHDGGNLLVEEDTFGGNDSIVIDNETNDIVAHFEYEEGALVTAVAGQHAGEIGDVEEINVTPGSSSNTVRVDTGETTFETVEEFVVVIDQNFVDDDAAGVDPEDTATDEESEHESADEPEETDDEAEEAVEADVEEDEVEEEEETAEPVEEDEADAAEESSDEAETTEESSDEEAAESEEGEE